MNKWQPISQCPVNQKVLLWIANAYGHNHVKTGIVDPKNYPQAIYSIYENGESLGMLPELYATHWQPLPEPPTLHQ